ncbi:MAG: hypothetical protein HN790_05610 [Methylococcales bacterium]|jgi:hypothetical protein|nr:hypothetical protein [Methylococcales bacterium]
MKMATLLLVLFTASSSAVAGDVYYGGYNPYLQYNNGGYGYRYDNRNGYGYGNPYGNGYGYPGYPQNHTGHNDEGGYYIRNRGRDAFITTPNPNAAKLPDPFAKLGE